MCERILISDDQLPPTGAFTVTRQTLLFVLPFLSCHRIMVMQLVLKVAKKLCYYRSKNVLISIGMHTNLNYPWLLYLSSSAPALLEETQSCILNCVCFTTELATAYNFLFELKWHFVMYFTLMIVVIENGNTSSSRWSFLPLPLLECECKEFLIQSAAAFSHKDERSGAAALFIY